MSAASFAATINQAALSYEDDGRLTAAAIEAANGDGEKAHAAPHLAVLNVIIQLTQELDAVPEVVAQCSPAGRRFLVHSVNSELRLSKVFGASPLSHDEPPDVLAGQLRKALTRLRPVYRRSA